MIEYPEYEYLLDKYMNLIESSLNYICYGRIDGFTATQLSEMMYSNLRNIIRKTYSREQILHELKTVFFIIWYRYKPERGDFYPYLRASLAKEIYKRFKRLGVWVYRETSLEEYIRRQYPGKTRNRLAKRQQELTQISDTRISSQQYTNLDNWTFNLPAIEKLSYRQENILRMKFLESLSTRDIAGKLDICERTVCRDFRKALASLRREICQR